ncbi:MAG TPA: ATP-binding protein, partial [Candidatus Limnocylindrales bacterium]|nr:ATP-binding protein [Candidatus Limnocylindrales bacterium]
MPVLFERDRDLGLLIDRVTGLADHAEGGVVIIEAPPGVGKTQLLATAIELAQARSVRVLTAHGVELEHELAFGGVRQLCAPTLARLDPVAVRDVLRGPAAGAGPILGISDVPVPAGAEPLFALTAMVSNLAARGPVAIAVDDLQWLDEASARFLAYLARRLDGLPVLIVSATRPLDPPLPELATAWPPGTVFIRPEPLSANGVGRLLETVLGTPIGDDVVTACGRVTGGNPFLVTEIGRELAALPATGRAERVEEIAPAAVGAAVL